MKFGKLIIGGVLVALSACSQVVIDPTVRSADVLPPLTAASPNANRKPQPALLVLPLLSPTVELLAIDPASANASQFADLPPSAFTVQIAAVKSLDMMDQIAAKHALVNNAIRVPTRDAQLGDLHAVLIGVYGTEAAAKAVVASLPPMIAGDEPWVRTVASVQAVMR